MRVVIPVTRDADDLWSEVFGSLGGASDHPWIRKIKYVVGNWEKNGLVDVTFEQQNLSADGVFRMKIEHIVEAYATLINESWGHCNGDSVSNPDACTADAILQTVIYGRIIYG